MTSERSLRAAPIAAGLGARPLKQRLHLCAPFLIATYQLGGGNLIHSPGLWLAPQGGRQVFLRTVLTDSSSGKHALFPVPTAQGPRLQSPGQRRRLVPPAPGSKARVSGTLSVRCPAAARGGAHLGDTGTPGTRAEPSWEALVPLAPWLLASSRVMQPSPRWCPGRDNCPVSLRPAARTVRAGGSAPAPAPLPDLESRVVADSAGLPLTTRLAHSPPGAPSGPHSVGGETEAQRQGKAGPRPLAKGGDAGVQRGVLQDGKAPRALSGFVKTLPPQPPPQG